MLQRSAASLARKLGNFGAFDPELKRRNISGLPHVSRLDREVWDDFNKDWSSLVLEAHRLRASLSRAEAGEALEQVPESAGERLVQARQRIHQSFFRAAVLSSYQHRCCVTGLPVPECLIAGHIVPWGVDERFRADPTNGLCLSATFHRLFDAGLMTISSDMRVCVSGKLLRSDDKAITLRIATLHGKPMMLPKRFRPAEDRLRWHRRNVFAQ
jgi:predicted restriction endonuclease